MIRRACNLFLSVCMLLVSSGCWDATAIEKRANIVAISFDYADGKYLIGATIPIPTKMEGGAQVEGNGEAPQIDALVEASSINEALDKIQTIVQRRLYFGQMAVMVFSEEVIKQGIRPLLDYFRRNEEVRVDAHVVVVDGKANKLLKQPSIFWNLAVQDVRSNLESAQQIGYGYESKYGQVLRDTNTLAKKNSVLNHLTYKNKQFQWDGSVILKEGKMLHFLQDQNLNNVLLQIRENKPGLSVRAVEGKGELAFLPLKARSTISFDQEDSPEKITINVQVEGYIEEKTTDVDLSQQQNIYKVERKLEKFYEEKAKEMLQLGEKLKVDFFFLGYYLRMYYPEVWSTKYKTFEQLSKIPVQVKYNVSIKHHGNASK